MSHLSQNLLLEFAEDAVILRQLKNQNLHFDRLSKAHEEVDAAIRRIEAMQEAASDIRLEDLKKQRLRILDEIAEMIDDTRHKLATTPSS